MREPWPAVPFLEWKETLATLHMEMQILGKVRVALSPPEPEWAHVALYVTSRGLSTGSVPMPGGGVLDVEADLVDHRVVVRTSDGGSASAPLSARPIQEFWHDFLGALDEAGVQVELSTMPQEVPDPVPFPDDDAPRVYEPAYARRFWRVLAFVDPVLAGFRAAYRGRVSPVHFFWGHMDLAVTRYAGRVCAPPADSDMLARARYDEEQMSCGFWAGDEQFGEAAFYSYAYPKPQGTEQLTVEPSAAAWDPTLGELILPYDAVRTTADPARELRRFLDSSYDGLARLAAWEDSAS